MHSFWRNKKVCAHCVKTHLAIVQHKSSVQLDSILLEFRVCYLVIFNEGSSYRLIVNVQFLAHLPLFGNLWVHTMRVCLYFYCIALYQLLVLKLLSNVLYNLSVCLFCGKKMQRKKKKRKMPKRLKGVQYMLECFIRLLQCNVILPILATYERNNQRKIAREQSCQPIKSEPS